MSSSTPMVGQSFIHRVRSGELGFLPIVGALLVIWAVFGLLNHTFLSSDNLVNLTLQSAASGIIALGIVLTLMIGQIDLSVGAVSGLGSAVVSVTVMRAGLPLWLAIAAALVVGVMIGAAYGLLFTRLGLPSFVFTLAGLLVVLGIQLRVLGSTGTVNLPYESWLVRFCQQMFLSPWLSYLLVAVVVIGYAASLVVTRERRLRVDLPADRWASIALRVGVLTLVAVVATTYLNTNRGVPYMFALFLALVAGTDVVLRRTRWGRAVRAVGGNLESARRAGLPVRGVVVSVFVACSTFAVIGGVLSAGRLASAYQGTGGTDASLTAIAAAVIGGVSLYGGRGSAWSALLGILVLQSISNGLTLMNMGASATYTVTGIVLAVAVIIDELSRRARGARGASRA
ncbi:D-xylose transport system permease protein [Sanguibacter gelidistatuariae]|uniref:Xylose transport system permease protein XylH n=1 Tax=Sanguibacter gelidistatuariae TaxID=1814289 RepID=A0A1G6KWW9_9MICO|nr:ABC transporter permease [Sanguibacter gelidistatuariae]SDC35474.1 D-xylose transport system permease protein [Sanguibacter gelidistatuariae]